MGQEVEYRNIARNSALEGHAIFFLESGTGVLGCKWDRILWHGEGFSGANLASR